MIKVDANLVLKNDENWVAINYPKWGSKSDVIK
jgi:hypothetical protein